VQQQGKENVQQRKPPSAWPQGEGNEKKTQETPRLGHRESRWTEEDGWTKEKGTPTYTRVKDGRILCARSTERLATQGVTSDYIYIVVD